MEWAEGISHPFLKDLPFKIELNKWGEVLMSLASNNHGRVQYGRNTGQSHQPRLIFGLADGAF